MYYTNDVEMRQNHLGTGSIPGLKEDMQRSATWEMSEGERSEKKTKSNVQATYAKRYECEKRNNLINEVSLTIIGK